MKPFTDAELRIMRGLGIELRGDWICDGYANKLGPARGMLDIPDFVRLATLPQPPWELLWAARYELSPNDNPGLLTEPNEASGKK